jgi:hypothetical protein
MQVFESQVPLALGVPVRCCPMIPRGRLGFVAGYALARLVKPAELPLGLGVALLRGAAIPGCGGGRITREALPRQGQLSEEALRLGVALGRGALQPLHRRTRVGGHALTSKLQQPETILGLSLALHRLLPEQSHGGWLGPGGHSARRPGAGTAEEPPHPEHRQQQAPAGPEARPGITPGNGQDPDDHGGVFL